MTEATKFMDAAACDKAITSIKNRGVKLDKDIHDAACSCLNALIKHGDTTLMNRLLLAMPKSGRKNALAAWMLNFGNVLLNDDKATKAERPLVYDKAGEHDIDGAIATPFWEFKASEGGTTFAVDTYLASVSKRLTTALKSCTDPIQREHAEKVLAALGSISM